jgi:hypothetical protein
MFPLFLPSLPHITSGTPLARDLQYGSFLFLHALGIRECRRRKRSHDASERFPPDGTLYCRYVSPSESIMGRHHSAHRLLADLHICLRTFSALPSSTKSSGGGACKGRVEGARGCVGGREEEAGNDGLSGDWRTNRRHLDDMRSYRREDSTYKLVGSDDLCLEDRQRRRVVSLQEDEQCSVYRLYEDCIYGCCILMHWVSPCQKY